MHNAYAYVYAYAICTICHDHVRIANINKLNMYTFEFVCMLA